MTKHWDSDRQVGLPRHIPLLSDQTTNLSQVDRDKITELGEDLKKIIQQVSSGAEIDEAQEYALSLAVASGLITYIPKEQFERQYQDAVTDLNYALSERESKKEEVTLLNTQLEELTSQLKNGLASLSDSQDHLEKKESHSFNIWRAKQSSWNRSIRGLKTFLSQFPVTSFLVSKPESYEAAEAKAKEDLVQAFKTIKVDLDSCVNLRRDHDELTKKANKQHELLVRLDQDAKQAKATLKLLSEHIETRLGYYRVSEEAKALAGLLENPSLAEENMRRILENHESNRALIHKRVNEVSLLQRELVEGHSYPVLGAEMVSWYLAATGSETSVAKTIGEFTSRSSKVADFVGPSYTQLFLSLVTPPSHFTPIAYMQRLSYLSRELPSFPRSQRYLIAREMEKLPCEEDDERQERVMAFVDAMTGENFEDLNGFEKFLLAAQIAGFEGTAQIVANTFTDIYNRLIDGGFGVGAKTCQLALVLMSSDSRGEERLKGFFEALELYKQVDPESFTEAASQCAFISLLPGDPNTYVYGLLSAETELRNLGMDPVKARTLSLPAALPVIECMWKSQIEAEGIRLARRVGELDDQISLSESIGSAKEELRNLRLSEELLSTVTALKELYRTVDGMSIESLWQNISYANGANSARLYDIDRGAGSKTNSGELEDDKQLPTLNELTARQGEVSRSMHESMFGGEYS